MFQNAFRTGPAIHGAFLCSALALGSLLVAGCSESGTPAPAKPNTAAASAPADPTKKVTEAAHEAVKTTTETAKAVTETAAKTVENTTAKAADATAKAADTTKAAVKEADKTAAAAQSALQASQAKMQAEAQAKADELNKLRAMTDEKMKAQAAENDRMAAEAKAKFDGTKPVDPMAQDTDPNSKARLTYEFGSDTKAFGKVMQGDVLTHKFRMQSSGEEDLVIKQAKPTCGCTVAQIMVEEGGAMVPYQYGKPIAPGKKVEIEATLHTQNKRGHASSKINMTTNDPRGQTILNLEADVDPFFQVNPPNVNFNQMSAKDTATDKITVTTTKGDRVKLSAVKDNMPQGLKIDVKPLDADADGKATRFEVVITAGPGLNEGNLAYSVPLRSDAPIPGGEKMPNGQMPTYEVSATIMARVMGAISFNPAFVSLGLIRPGQTLSRSVRITSHDAAFKLSDVVTDAKVSIQGRDTVEWEFAKNFTKVVRPVAGENSVDVEVTLTGMPDSLSGSFSGNLVITIGHPEKPEIKLPITGVCRGGAGDGLPPTPAPLPTPAGGTPK